MWVSLFIIEIQFFIEALLSSFISLLEGPPFFIMLINVLAKEIRQLHWLVARVQWMKK
jgi:hypothetical protein